MPSPGAPAKGVPPEKGAAPDRRGELVRLDVGPVAHGGHCVARLDGRVVFVRHALPGEEVRARLTEAGERDRFWRAEAVEVLRASPDRVEPACPVARPGLCGGCDWQHASLDAQRRLKAAVVREQLQRLGGVDVPDLVVEPVPGDDRGLGWRTRVRFAVDGAGRVGLRRHRSHDVVPVEECPIADPEVNAVGVGHRRWAGTATVEVVVAPAALEGAGPQRLVVVEPSGGAGDGPAPGLAAALSRRGPDGLHQVRGRTWLEEHVLVGGSVRRFRVTGGGFWQVHPGAAQALLDAVLGAAVPRPGERALDCYSGAGLFAAGLAAAVGPGGDVVAVEGDARAVADARRNLHDLPWVRLRESRVDRALAAAVADGERYDVVVLDPPRTGAGREVVQAVAALRPRAVAYVACDPAALARDLRTAAAAGYRLAALRAFDLFPMTHHVECLATLVPEVAPAGGPEIS